MKTRPIFIKIIVTFICLFAVTALKAQSSLTTTAIYCKGAEVKMNVAAGATAYIWKRYKGKDLTDPAPVTLTANVTNQLTDIPADPGYYTYVSIAVNGNSCESAPSDPATIYVLPGIQVAITSTYSADPLCTTVIPAAGTLTAVPTSLETVPETFSATDDYTYQWYRGGIAITNAKAVTYTLGTDDVAAAGTNIEYTVKVNYKAHACTEATSDPVKFNIIATPAKPQITIQ